MRKIKTTRMVLLILLVQVIYAPAAGSSWNISVLHTAAGVSYLSEIEKEIVLEINKLRSDPTRYAEEYIAPLAKNYDRRILHYPGDNPLITREGVSALHECVRELKKQEPLPLMHPSSGLTMAARDHVKDQSKSGKTGHTGGDKSGMRDRIERYGQWEVRIAENIAYGAKTARQIVVYLLIDDGVRDRGHRKNFLNPDFITVGVATGGHPHYDFMSVMDFAGGFKTATQ
jgi:uncharacterized protein YkwD